MTLLEVENLTTRIATRGGAFNAVDGVSFALDRGEALGLVGESGSGKSMTCLSLVRLLPKRAAQIVDGSVRLDGQDLTALPERSLRRLRGSEIAMILQDPLLSLNPVFTIGSQVAEAVRLERPRPRRDEVRARTIAELARVHIPSPEQRLGSYPFQFSGGMRQRVAAAISIARGPKLLIADEPTTALDVTTQRQFLDLLTELRREDEMALLLVTHDLALVRETCDRVAIMYAGRIVEHGPVGRVFDAPSHPYTRALLESIPSLTGARRARLTQIAGEPPDMHELPVGCRFAPRCPFADERGRASYPPSFAVPGGGEAACWLQGDRG
jgi:oligopeptide/dipeptide ABC transporter ATP-binding protein